MGIIAPTLPTLGAPFPTEAADVGNALQTIINEINGGLDNANIEDGTVTPTELTGALLTQLGVTGGGVTRSGVAIVDTEEARTNTAYGLMPTPDRVQGIVVPTNGLLDINFLALWKNSVASTGRAAIFIGANQLKVLGSNGAPVVQEVNGPSGTVYNWLASRDAVTPVGLTSTDGTVTDASSTTTGAGLYGSLRVFVAAGTYDVSVQFKSASGSVTVKERKLWVRARGF